MIVSALFGTAFTRLPPIGDLLVPPVGTLFPRSFSLFAQSSKQEPQSGLFPPSVKLQKSDAEIHGWIKWLFLVRKMISIHLLIPYPDISDLLTRGKYMSVKVHVGPPIRDVRLPTRSIKTWYITYCIGTVLYAYLCSVAENENERLSLQATVFTVDFRPFF
jgi:hypothetical protein